MENRHKGSSLDSFLEEMGIEEEVNALAAEKRKTRRAVKKIGTKKEKKKNGHK